MSLLPKSHKDFGTSSYWEEFFKKRGEKAFEWYGEYNELCTILHKYVKLTDDILVVGCGNSNLSADLFDLGHKKITNIDISDVVIRQMVSKHSDQRPELKFIKMDMLEMNFPDDSFSVVLDKGTLDAVMTDESEATMITVDKMFCEIGRVLRIGGRYICITLSQDHIIRKVLDYFSNEGWPVRVCRVEDIDDVDENEFHMPVFAFVFTKFKKMPAMKPILEVAYFYDKKERYDTKEEIVNAVKELQYYGVVRQQLNNRKLLDEEISLELFSADQATPRYTLHIVDCDLNTANKFAIFIVPDGRETEWMFSSEKGRKSVAESAGFQRLVIVTLSRDHLYENLAAIKAELSSKVMELAPHKLGTAAVPFLSAGDDINQREIKHKGNSDISGNFVVEDVVVDNELNRRLIFLSNRNAVQSAAKLIAKPSKKKKNGKKTKVTYDIDHRVLCCQHHSVMVAGLAFIDNIINTLGKEKLNIALIGLGGGALATFLHKHFKKVHITAVELDKCMVDVATKWFGFQEDEYLQVRVNDGLIYLQELARKGRKKLHTIFVDVDSKDLSKGISSPPASFLEKEFMQTLSNLLLPEGVLVMNLVCRDISQKEEVMQRLKMCFQTVFCRKVPMEVNEVIFALPKSRTTELRLTEDGRIPEIMCNNLKHLQKMAREEVEGAEVASLPYKLHELKKL